MGLIQRTPLGNSADETIGFARHDLLKMVDVGGVAVPSQFEIDFPGEGEQPGVRIEAQLVDGVMRCQRITVTANPGGKPVTGAVLREIRLESWVDQVAKLLATPTEQTAPGKSVAKWRGDAPLDVAGSRTIDKLMPKRGRQPLSDEHYAAVAQHYFREADGVKGVAEAMGAPFQSAARWVREAKRRGLIAQDESEQGAGQ